MEFPAYEPPIVVATLAAEDAADMVPADGLAPHVHASQNS